MPATPGYEEASKRAEAAAKADREKKAQEAEQRRQDYERSSRRAEQYKRAQEDPAYRLQQEQIKKAKETPGAQSSTIRVDRASGQAEIRETSRDIRSGVPQRQYTTEYANAQLNQQFGSRRAGDYLRRDQARKDEALSRTRNVSEFGDVLKSQTTRKSLDNEETKQFSRVYADYQRGAETLGPRARRNKGGSITEGTLPRAYSVNLEDTISNRPAPGQRQYQVFLEDRISGGPYAYERRPGETSRSEDRIGLSDDPLKAFAAPIENIYTQYIVPGTQGVGIGIGSLFGGKPNNLIKQTEKIGAEAEKAEKPEVAGAFFSDVIIPVGQRGASNLASLVTTGKQSKGTSQFVNREFADFQAQLEKENSASVAASIAGSVVAFLPDVVFRGGARAGRFVGGLFSKGAKVERIEPTIPEFAATAKRFENARIDLGAGVVSAQKQATVTFKPTVTTKKVTTLADIDKRLKDLGKDFTQSGRSGQSTVLLKPQKTRTFQNVTIPLNIEKSAVKAETITRTKLRTGLRSSLGIKLGTGTGQAVSIKAIVNELVKPFAGQKQTTGLKAVRAQRIRQSDIVRELEAQVTRVAPLQRAKTGIRQRVEQIPGLKQQLNAAQKFRFDQIYKQQTGTLFSTRTGQLTRTQLRELGISELMQDVLKKPTGRLPPPPGGKQRQTGRKKKGRGRAVLRGFKAGSLPLAFLGPKSTLAREFEKTFGDFY